MMTRAAHMIRTILFTAGFSAAAALFAGPARADNIVLSDDFNYSTFSGAYDGVLPAGNSPSTQEPIRAPHGTNLPDGKWMTPGGNPDDTLATGPDHQSAFPTEAFRLRHGAGAALPIASNGSYVKPTEFIISIDVAGLSPATTRSGATPYLGFWAAAYNNRASSPNPFGSANAGFTGLRLEYDGSLVLIENGTAGAAIAFTGTFDPMAGTTITYTVNTADGSISNVSLAGSSSTYYFATTAFTDAATNYAGIGIDGNDGFVDNFIITAIPEPATLALFAAGGLMIATRRRSHH